MIKKITINIKLDLMNNIAYYPTTLFFIIKCYILGINSDIWVMIRESNGMWEKIRCRLEPAYNQMKLRLNGIKMK